MNVVVTGIPNSTRMKVPQLVFLFRPVLRNVNIEKFWIKEIYEVPGTDTKAATIEFPSPDEAYSAAKVLNDFVYRDRQARYHFQAQTDAVVTVPGPYSESPSPYGRKLTRRERRDTRNMEKDSDRYYRSDRFSSERDRSRSPQFNNEVSKLDLEIELLKKKKKIIEEERRLLLERNKLQKAKESGPSGVVDTKFMKPRSRAERRTLAPEDPEFQRRRPPRPQDKYALKGQTFDKTSQMVKLPYKDRLPAFYSPCNMILGDMKEVIKKNVPPGMNDLLYKLLRTSLRKRLTLALDSERKKLNTKQIFSVYREMYPKTADDLIVKKVLDDIKACDLSKESTSANEESLKSGKDANAIQEGGEKESTKAEKGSTIAGQEIAIALNENKKQEENTTAEVNKKVETDTLVGAANIKTETAIKNEIKAEPVIKKAVETEPVIKKAEEITQDTSIVSEKAVAEVKTVDSTEVAMAVDNVADDWEEGDDWNDLETVESEEMVQG